MNESRASMDGWQSSATLQESISTVQSAQVGATRRSSTGATWNPRNPIRCSVHRNVLPPDSADSTGAKLSSALVLSSDSTPAGCRRNSPMSIPPPPPPPCSGSTSRSLMRSRRLADSRARRLLPGAASVVDTDWPLYSSPPPPLLPAAAARHDRRPEHLLVFSSLDALRGSAAAADGAGTTDWCFARKKEADLVAAAVGLIPSSAASSSWLRQQQQQLQPCMDMDGVARESSEGESGASHWAYRFCCLIIHGRVLFPDMLCCFSVISEDLTP